MKTEELLKKDTNLWKRAFIGGALLIILPLFGTWYYHQRHYEWTNDAYLDGYQISISPDINARLMRLYFEEGDTVQKGDLLCQLDESIYLSQKEDALSSLELLGKQVELKAIQMKKAKTIYDVAVNEYEKGIVSFLDFDEIEKNFLISEADYKVAIAAQANGIAKLGVIDELLLHTKIYAPQRGAIAKRWVVPGDAVSYGQPLLSLTDTESIWVNAIFEENQVRNIRSGNKVKIHVDAYPDIEFTGTVFQVMASTASKFAFVPPNNATGNFTKVIQRVPVKIFLDPPKTNDYLHLCPGMSVEVDVRVR